VQQYLQSHRMSSRRTLYLHISTKLRMFLTFCTNIKTSRWKFWTKKPSNSIWLSVLLYPKEVWNETDVSFYQNSAFKFDTCLMTQPVTEAWLTTSPTSSLHYHQHCQVHRKDNV
jgi:hypothetical protein